MSSCLLSLIIAVLASLAASAVQGEEPLRDRLSEALEAHRLRSLGLMVSREAYAAHARMLNDQPEKLGTALFYQGLVEVEYGDTLRARSFFTEAIDRLPSSSPLRSKAELWKEALETGEVNLSGEPSAREAWRMRIAVAVDPIAGRADLPLPPSANASDWLDLLLATRDGATRVAATDASNGIPIESDLWSTPQTILWLRDLENPETDIEYRFHDPGIWTALLLLRTQSLTAAIGDREDPEAQLARIWCHCLRGDLVGQDSRWEAWDEDPEWEQWTRDEQHELACLGMASGRLEWTVDVVQRWRDRMKAQQDGLPGAIPLWGLRALNLADRSAVVRLEAGQHAIREFTQGKDPFDSSLLFPRKASELAAADALRDYYAEIAWVYRALHIERQGTRAGERPDLPILSAKSILATVASPQLRLPGRRWPLLRTLMQADVACRCGDWESWQNQISDEEERRLPIPAPLRSLGRSVAAAVRIRSDQNLHHRDAELFPDPVEVLLTERRDFVDAPRKPPGEERVDAVKGRERGAWLRGMLWKLAIVSLASSVLVMALLSRFFRAPETNDLVLTPAFAPAANESRSPDAEEELELIDEELAVPSSESGSLPSTNEPSAKQPAGRVESNGHGPEVTS